MSANGVGACAGGSSARTGKVKGSRRKFPAEYKVLRAPAARLSWLAGEACQGYVDRGELSKAQVDKEAERLSDAAAEINGIVPSPSRLADWYGGEAFPPEAADPANACRRARRMLNPGVERPHLFPAVYLTNRGATYDAVIWDDIKRRRGLDRGGDEESPSSRALRALEDRRGELVESIHPDDAAEDREQLEAYRQAVGAEEFARIEVAFR
jgi:hypothetical protein